MIIFNKDTVAQNNFLSLYSYSLFNISDDTIKLLLENKKPEGFYHSIIHINNRKKTAKLLYFKNIDNKLTPYFSIDDFISLGIDSDFYKIDKKNKGSILLSDLSIDFKYHFSNQKLNLIIPQKALIKTTDYIANEQNWDDGITALFTQYSYWIKYHQKNLLSKSSIYIQELTWELGVYVVKVDLIGRKIVINLSFHQYMHIDKLILFLLFFMVVIFHLQHEYYQLIK